MNSTLVVGEHPVPVLVVSTIPEDVLATVASSAVPVLDCQALVERKSHRAMSIPGEPTEPIFQLPSQ
jgi:hypothetical protein